MGIGGTRAGTRQRSRTSRIRSDGENVWQLAAVFAPEHSGCNGGNKMSCRVDGSR